MYWLDGWYLSLGMVCGVLFQVPVIVVDAGHVSNDRTCNQFLQVICCRNVLISRLTNEEDSRDARRTCNPARRVEMVSIIRQQIVHDGVLGWGGQLLGLSVVWVTRFSGKGVWGEVGFSWDMDGEEAKSKCLHLEILESWVWDAGQVLTAKSSQQRLVVKAENEV